MTQLDEGHFELHSANKDRVFKKKEKARVTIKQLLQDVNSDELIKIINEERIFNVSVATTKKTCPRCKGNGYYMARVGPYKTHGDLEKTVQCDMCNSQGEIDE